jgi:NTP pyrophosphatase (non-canonical NTP hydrolase)
MRDFLCPSCAKEMVEYKENHYRCTCGARMEQITIFEGEETNMELNQLRDEVKRLLDEKGFAYDESTFWEKATLLHTEVSELADVIKKQGYEAKEDIEGEVADIIIRTMNFALMFDLDVEALVRKKMDYNFKRPFKYNTHEEEK